MLSPIKGFFDARTELGRRFEELFGGLTRRSERTDGWSAEWTPAIDAFSRGGDLVIRAELAGVKPEDVDITLANGVLTISGERKVEHESKGDGYYVRERRYGRFRRSVTLPEGVEEDRVHARFGDGVLEVTIEGAVAAIEPKRIRIEGPEDGGLEG